MVSAVHRINAAFGVSPKFVPWRGITVPTIHSNSSGKITIDRGGYVKVGNICTITMRVTVSTAIDENKWIFYQIPHHVFDINGDHGVMCERIKAVSTTNNNEVVLNLSGYDNSMSGIGTGSGTTLPVGTYNLSLSYISDK